jgi:hypothetical protein
MSKIGSYDYPDTRIGTLLKALDVLVRTMNGEAKEEKNFASAIGHKNIKSGGYLQKVADLRRYGFIEKGRFTATANAKKIIQPLSNEEKQKALNECIMGVGIWKEMFNRLNGDVPSNEDFKIHLSEITGDRDKAYKDGETIRNLYIDVLKYYVEGAEKVAKKTSSEIDKNLGKIDDMETSQSLEPKKILLKFDGNNVLLDKNDANIDVLKSILEGLKEKKK